MPVGTAIRPKTPHKRLGLRAQHIIRLIRGSNHTSVQRSALNELGAEIDRRARPRGRSTKRSPTVTPGDTGFWTPLSARAKHALHRLRTTRNYHVQVQLVNEVRHEVLRAEARELRRIKARQWAERQWERAKNGGRATRGWFVRRGHNVRNGYRRVRGSSMWRRVRNVRGSLMRRDVRAGRTPVVRIAVKRVPATRTPAARTPAARTSTTRARKPAGERTARTSSAGGAATSRTSRASAASSRASRS